MVLVLGHPLKSAQIGVECLLEDSVVSGGHVLVLCLLDKTCKGLHDEADVVITKIKISHLCSYDCPFI